MSKCLLFSDIHVGEYSYGKVDPNSGLNQRLLDIQQALDYIYKYAKKNKVDHIFIGGDCYDRKMPKNHVRKVFTNAIKKFLKAGMHVYIITGNHDQALSNHTNHSLVELQEIKDLVPNIHIYNEPEIIIIDDLSFVLFPFVNKNELKIKDFREWNKEKLQELRAEVSTNKSIMIGHFGTELSLIHQKSPLPEDIIELKYLESLKFDLVVLGHIHTNQELSPNIYHVGSTVKTSFNEEKDTKYFMEFDTKDIKVNFIEVPDRPFHTFEVDVVDNDLNEFDKAFKKIKQLDLSEAITRVKLRINEKDLGNIDLNQMTDYLTKNSYKFMSTAKNIIPMEKTNSEIGENDSPAEALDLYINENKEFFGDDLDFCLDLGREILGNVGG